MTIGGMTYTTKNAIHVTTLVTSSTTRFYGHEASRSLVCLVMRCKARWPKMIVWVVVNIKGLRVTSRCPASRNAAAPPLLLQLVCHSLTPSKMKSFQNNIKCTKRRQKSSMTSFSLRSLRSNSFSSHGV